MSLFKKFINQTRKPEGFLGKLMVGGMNGGHARLADWGMTHLSGITPAKIAELGCGGGRNAGELMKRYPKAKLTAVDYSELSVQKTKEYNKYMIASGRCAVIRASVAELPQGSASADLATAFETVYFWPGLENCFAEVCRILKPGGTFLICNESDGTDETSKKYEKLIDGMRCYTADELEKALRAAGFSEVKADHHPAKPWITVIARK
ncbi:MAG: class I SAM-dependent methyltransferase [Clostridia bacterium]|nr:class I SAM-dependent methyltransferase [Clostridia bacterium]